jgi:hypothetical protein
MPKPTTAATMDEAASAMMIDWTRHLFAWMLGDDREEDQHAQMIRLGVVLSSTIDFGDPVAPKGWLWVGGHPINGRVLLQYPQLDYYTTKFRRRRPLRPISQSTSCSRHECNVIDD